MNGLLLVNKHNKETEMLIHDKTITGGSYIVRDL